MAVPTGLCAPWLTADDIPEDLYGELTADDVDVLCELASEILYVAANCYWPGTCERTVRPDLGRRSLWWTSGAAGAWGSTAWTDLPWWASTAYPPAEARWFNCDQRNMTRFRLPGPVQTVSEVLIDGVALDAAAYFVESRATLVRVDGNPWPTGQDLTRDPSDTDASGAPAWSVTYEWGDDPPPGGVLAAKSLAVELLFAATDCGRCRLPWAGAVATAQRKGTTVSYQSLSDKFAKGEVGLADVDVWLNAARGGAVRQRRARIGRADARPRNQRVTVW